METFSALLVICAGNSPVTGEVPVQRPVMRRFGVGFFYICAWINDWVNNGEACDLRRHSPHYDVTVMVFQKEGSQLHAPSHCRKMMKIGIYYMFHNINSARQILKLIQLSAVSEWTLSWQQCTNPLFGRNNFISWPLYVNSHALFIMHCTVINVHFKQFSTNRPVNCPIKQHSHVVMALYLSKYVILSYRIRHVK